VDCVEAEPGVFWFDEQLGRWIEQEIALGMGELPSVPLDRLGWWMVAWPVEPTGCVREAAVEPGGSGRPDSLGAQQGVLGHQR